MNVRFHADVEDVSPGDAILVHGTRWGSWDGAPSSSPPTKRLACDGSPIIMMMSIMTATEEPVTCLECIAKMR